MSHHVPTFQKRQHRNLADTEFRTLHKYRTPPSTHPPSRSFVSRNSAGLYSHNPPFPPSSHSPRQSSHKTSRQTTQTPTSPARSNRIPTLHPKQPVPPYRSNPKSHSHTRVYLTTIYVSPPTRSTILIQSTQTSTWTVKSQSFSLETEANSRSGHTRTLL